MILTDYELALLYSANGDSTQMEKVVVDTVESLVKMGLVAADLSADGAGYVITESGKRFLAENMNNRGVA